MSPPLALFLTVVFVLFLFLRDVRERPRITGAVWIPLMWVLILGSRGASAWLGHGGTYHTPSGLAEGSPLDAATYGVLELAGLLVLVHRGVSLSTVLARNPWMTAFAGYCALSILWSDFPFVAFKRWIKELGHPIMILVLATEPDPREAVTRLLKRAAYVLVPFSILFIKYYPSLGRTYSEWTGAVLYTGVTTDKNALGYVCFVLGSFFVWYLLERLRDPAAPTRRNDLILGSAFLYMIGWLMAMANSMTALMSLVVAAATLVVLGMRFVDRERVGGYALAAVVSFLVAEFLLGITDVLIQALGRAPTLTGRTELWAALGTVDINPIIGVGFQSFWLGRRAEFFWEMFSFRPNQAHNGYLETYLNLGWIGIVLLVALLLSTFRRVTGSLLSDFGWGRFRLSLLVAVIIYNYTEAAFKGLHLVWWAFYLSALDYPASRSEPKPGPRPPTRGLAESARSH